MFHKKLDSSIFNLTFLTDLQKKILLITILISTAIFMGFFLKTSFEARQKLVVVDTSFIINKIAYKLVQQNNKEAFRKPYLQHIADSIKEYIATYARHKNMIVLAKGVVIGGDLPDYTQAICRYICNNFNFKKNSLTDFNKKMNQEIK